MIGGVMNSASKKLMKECHESPWLLMVFGLVFLLLKAWIVQWSYNQVWPRLVANSGSTAEKFRPLTFYEALLVVILFTFLV